MALRIVRKSVGLRPRTFGGGRSAEISSNSASISNDVILCPIGLVPRHRESPQVVANQGESDPARPVNQFPVRLSVHIPTPDRHPDHSRLRASGVRFPSYLFPDSSVFMADRTVITHAMLIVILYGCTKFSLLILSRSEYCRCKTFLNSAELL